MTYKLNQSLLQKLRNGEIAIDNRGNPNVELLKQILRVAFPKDTGSPTVGMHNYYCSIGSNGKLWGGEDNLPLGFQSIPLNDFIQKEVVVGYKLKAERFLPEYLNSISLLCDEPMLAQTAPTKIPDFNKIPSEHPWIEKLRQAGVLDLWFDVITEEPKEENLFPPKGRLVDDDLYNKLYHHYKLNELLVAGKIPFDKIEDLVKQYDK